MSDDDSVHEGRSAVLSALERADLDLDETQAALELASRQLRTRSLAHAAAAAAGYELTETWGNPALELYADIRSGYRDVGFLAKGWEDPGFRVGDIVLLPYPEARLSGVLPALREQAALRGVALTARESEGVVEIHLEQVLYQDGFNASALAGTLTGIGECRRLIEPLVHELVREDIERREYGAS